MAAELHEKWSFNTPTFMLSLAASLLPLLFIGRKMVSLEDMAFAVADKLLVCPKLIGIGFHVIRFIRIGHEQYYVIVKFSLWQIRKYTAFHRTSFCVQFSDLLWTVGCSPMN